MWQPIFKKHLKGTFQVYASMEILLCMQNIYILICALYEPLFHNAVQKLNYYQFCLCTYRYSMPSYFINLKPLWQLVLGRRSSNIYSSRAIICKNEFLTAVREVNMLIHTNGIYQQIRNKRAKRAFIVSTRRLSCGPYDILASSIHKAIPMLLHPGSWWIRL